MTGIFHYLLHFYFFVFVSEIPSVIPRMLLWGTCVTLEWWGNRMPVIWKRSSGNTSQSGIIAYNIGDRLNIPWARSQHTSGEPSGKHRNESRLMRAVHAADSFIVQTKCRPVYMREWNIRHIAQSCLCIWCVTAKRKESRRANGRTRKERPRFPLWGHDGIGKTNTVQELKSCIWYMQLCYNEVWWQNRQKGR